MTFVLANKFIIVPCEHGVSHHSLLRFIKQTFKLESELLRLFIHFLSGFPFCAFLVWRFASGGRILLSTSEIPFGIGIACSITKEG